MADKIKIVSRWNADTVLFECDAPDGLESGLLQYLIDACEDDERGCLVWGLPLTAGAGRISIGGRREYAHRVMYRLINGVIPDGLLVRHTCDNHACIRPDHLILGTHAENMRDMVERGRSTKGRVLTAEHRLKVAKALRGRKQPDAVRQAIAAGVRRHFAEAY
jgi:hypothetical protein